MFRKVMILVILLISLGTLLYSATLEETLQSLSGDAAKAYVKPMVTSFGSDMNGGWFHKAPKAKMFGWDFELGVVMMGTMFSDDDKEFNVTGSFRFTQDQAEQLAQDYQDEEYYDELVRVLATQNFRIGIAGPTITGPTYDETTGDNSIIGYFPAQPVHVTYNGVSMDVPVPGQAIPIGFGGLLEDLPALPLAAPQLSIGTVAGTQLSFRYLPDTELTPEIGKLKYSGFGIQHNPAVWIPFKMPVDMAVSFFTQKLELGTIVESNASTFGLNVSKTLGLKLMSVTPYAGIAAEQSNMKFKYDYITNSDMVGVPASIPISFEVEGKNKSRITAGLSFRLALVNLNFDYNIAKYPSASMGAMLNFGW